jgi:hypothetical protein
MQADAPPGRIGAAPASLRRTDWSVVSRFSAADTTGEVQMLAQIRHLVPNPRQPGQPKRYVGRHRVPEPVEEPTPQPAPADAEAAVQV